MKRYRSVHDEEHRVLQKGPRGFNLCRWCKTECPHRGRTFCSKACVHEWRIRSDGAYIRRQVEARDHGVCALCGQTDERWQVDHIIPVAEGGGDCGLDNLRTLCMACHPRETGRLRRRLNAKRAAQQPLFDRIMA